MWSRSAASLMKRGQNSVLANVLREMTSETPGSCPTWWAVSSAKEASDQLDTIMRSFR